MTRPKKPEERLKLGRPKTGIGFMIGLRWHEDDLKAIDDWRRKQPDIPSRTESIRRLTKIGLGKDK